MYPQSMFLSKNKKKTSKKIIIFTGFNNCCILHRHVWVMMWTNKIWDASWENQHFAYAKTKTLISFAVAKTKTLISFAVTAKLISAFVFATWIVWTLFFLNPKFQASSRRLYPFSLVCVGPGPKPECWFSHDTAHMTTYWFSFLNYPQICKYSVLLINLGPSLNAACCKQKLSHTMRKAISWIIDPVGLNPGSSTTQAVLSLHGI